MLYISIALSAILSFLLTEATGLLCGGLITAGYLSYWLLEPYRVLSTLSFGVVIALLLKLVQSFFILYGRRKFIISIILSLLGVLVVGRIYYFFSAFSEDIRIIGYIIPGLLAYDMDRQGIVKTTVAVVALSLVVRVVTLALAFV